MRFIRPSGVLLASLVALLSCSDPSGPSTPTSIAVVSGSGQTAAVATTLPQPVVVEVKDVNGRAVRGVVVNWSISAGNGSVGAPTSTTDGQGRAQVLWTLGTVSGENRLNAGITSVAPTSVTAAGVAGAAQSARVLSGDAQTGIVSVTLGGDIAIRVEDSYGNGVAGATVTFTGDGSFNQPVVSTDATGAATSAWTLGAAAGGQTGQAAVSGIATAALQFTATALPAGDLIPLQDNVPVTGINAAQGTILFFRVAVPEGATRLEITTAGGPGDADIFVRAGALPTYTQYDCRSITPTTAESCSIATPAAGDWYVLLEAYSAYSDLTIRARSIIGGALNLNVTGLPAGRQGSVEISGPLGFNVNVGTQSVLEALDPGTYTITASFVQFGDTVYVVAPETQQVNIVQGETANVAVTYAESTGGLNLDISRAYITQAVQRTDGSVALIAGRAGLLRVFARGNAANSARPAVRARFYRDGALVQTYSREATEPAVPVDHDEALLSSTWNIPIPGSVLQPGVSMLIDVDPGNGISEPDETDNTWPRSGAAVALDVRTAPPFQARLVPVTQSDGSAADVTEANKDSYVTLAGALYPLPSVDVDVRAPYTFTGVLPSQYDSVWSRLLNEVRLLRIADASSRFYYGVIKPSYSFGGTGLGYIGYPAALGVDLPNWRAETAAHEWGHNFGRFHVGCGNPSNPDPAYPYLNGRLGHHGYDIRTNQIRELDTHHDLMSYCQPTWSSDYTYEAVMDFRGTATAAGTAAAAGTGAAEPALLVWGRITPDGAVLEPAFEVVTRPALPGKRGQYRLTAHSAAGSTVLDMMIDGYEIDHMPGVRVFAYAIPLRSFGGRAPAELRLRGPGVAEVRSRAAAPGGADGVTAERVSADRIRLRWNAVRSPVVMVRDGRTREILSFARGGDAEVATAAAEVEVSVSNGVNSTMRRIAVPR